MKDKYQKTIYACFIGYVVQAVVNNFVPLLFLTFEKTSDVFLPSKGRRNTRFVLVKNFKLL